MTHNGQTGIIIPSQGYNLLGTLFLAAGDTAKPTAIVLHGIPGIEKNYDIALALRAHGWNALIFHYRGCWGSPGDYKLASIPGDVTAAVDAITSGAYPQVDPERVILIGHSLGGWATVLAGARDSRPRGFAVIGGVSMPALLPLKDPALAASGYTDFLSGITPNQLASQWSRIGDDLTPTKQVHLLAPRPLLIIHGGQDVGIPPIHAETLHENAAHPKTLAIHPDANHSFTWHRDWLWTQLWGWLKNFPFNDTRPEENPVQ